MKFQYQDLPKGTPEAGDIGFRNVDGVAGRFISLGQWFVKDSSPYEHVFGVVNDVGNLVESVPFHSRFGHIDKIDDPDIVYMRFTSLNVTERKCVSKHWSRIVHNKSKYSFMQYPAIGLHRLGIKNKRMLRYIAKSNRNICSQHIDVGFQEAAKELDAPHLNLFSDDRAKGFVVPGSIWRLRWREDVHLFTYDRKAS